VASPDEPLIKATIAIMLTVNPAKMANETNRKNR
jgi:hypothetical protein